MLDREPQKDRGAPKKDSPPQNATSETFPADGALVAAWLGLQESAGNQAVAAMIARWPFGWAGASSAAAPVTPSPTQTRTPIRSGGGTTTKPARAELSAALGFESQFQNPGAWASRLKHPITQTLIRLLHQQLHAKFVRNDDRVFLKYARQQMKLTGVLWRTLYGLQDQAPSRWMFQAEFMVLGSLLSEIEGAVARIQRGDWSEGREEMVVRSLILFETGFARVISGSVRPLARASESRAARSSGGSTWGRPSCRA